MPTQAQHTPGPWEIPPTEWEGVGGDDFTNWGQILDAQGNCVACVDSEANARLICSVHSLLAVAIMAEVLSSKRPFSAKEMALLNAVSRAAIAKAKGNTHA